MEIVIIAVIAAAVIALVAYLIMQNLKDQKSFEDDMNRDLLRRKDRESGLDRHRDE